MLILQYSSEINAFCYLYEVFLMNSLNTLCRQRHEGIDLVEDKAEWNEKRKRRVTIEKNSSIKNICTAALRYILKSASLFLPL